MRLQLTLTEEQHQTLYKHLFPGDGLEAIAFVICGHARGAARHRLLVKDVVPLPYDQCERHRDQVSWSTDDILPLLERAEVEGASVIKIHSHPQGFPRFSEVDNESDRQLLPTIRSWVEADIPHGSAIMLPDGKIFARYLWKGQSLKEFDGVNVVGSSLQFWWKDDGDSSGHEFGQSHDQAFGEGTTKRMRRLRVAVVGASGTGSIVIEQLARLGVGHLVLIDDDKIEERNLNRILFATAKDAKNNAAKVLSAARDIKRKGLNTKVTPIVAAVQTSEAVRAIAQCDVLFGCVDTAHGRFIMNLAASHYLLPYFDLGILLDAEQEGNGRGAIKDILGTIHYLVPGCSSLLTRDHFTMEDVRTEGLHKNDPVAAKQQIEDKYIKGLQVRRPAVISVNMLAASIAVNDFLARLHPYRKVPNSDIASIEFSLGDPRFTYDQEVESCTIMNQWVGHGDRKPLLGLMEIGI
ncbi:MAG: hypothetical protein RL141_206 [Candidatus Parcubacteria bacterium]|jgi:hypothetical protein